MDKICMFQHSIFNNRSIFLSYFACYTQLKMHSLFCMLTGWNMVELVSLNSAVDRLEHGWAGQLEQCCWHAWTWLSWPAWTVLLTGLNMVELHDQLEQCCWQAWTWLSWPAWTWLLTGFFIHFGPDYSRLDEWIFSRNRKTFWCWIAFTFIIFHVFCHPLKGRVSSLASFKQQWLFSFLKCTLHMANCIYILSQFFTCAWYEHCFLQNYRKIGF